MARLRFHPALSAARRFSLGDAVILLALAAFLYLGVRLALHAPAAVAGPEISLEPGALPWYAAFSLARMSAAYALSLAFSLAYGYYAARNRRAEQVMMPLLDVLQSVPILSFLPVVLLSLSVVLPAAAAAGNTTDRESSTTGRKERMGTLCNTSSNGIITCSARRLRAA